MAVANKAGIDTMYFLRRINGCSSRAKYIAAGYKFMVQNLGTAALCMHFTSLMGEISRENAVSATG
jgi:hypothetical protein